MATKSDTQADARPPNLRITRLALLNWKNFPSIDAALQARTFVVGANASGKSNLLDAIRFLSDLVRPRGGGLQEAIEGSRGGMKKIRSIHARRRNVVGLTVFVGTDSDPNRWEYRVEFKVPKGFDTSPVVHKEVLRRSASDELIWNRPEPDDEADPRLLTQTFLEQTQKNGVCLELVDFLQSVRYLHIVPQIIRDAERRLERRSDPFGSDFIESIAATNARTRDARLRRISEALSVAVPELQSLSQIRDEHTGIPHLEASIDHWRKIDNKQREDQFSDGTLRLIGLLWAIQDGRGPLLLEEPELSLHVEIVRSLPEIFSKVQSKTQRQLVVSTHSLEMLRNESVEPDEVLVLQASREGTTASSLSDDPKALSMLEAGSSLPAILAPKTTPSGVRKLTLVDFL